MGRGVADGEGEDLRLGVVGEVMDAVVAVGGSQLRFLDREQPLLR